MPSALVRLLLSLLLGLLTPCATSTPLSVLHSVDDLWKALVTGAAKATIKAVKAEAEIDLELQNVPMETFQVLVGRQHHLALEVDGVSYDLLIGNEAEALEQARQRTAASTPSASSPSSPAQALPSGPSPTALPPGSAESPTAGAQTATPSDSLRGADAAPLQIFTGPRSTRILELPEMVLSGPLELVLREPEPVGIYTPLAADVGGPVRRVVVDAGATVRVAGLRRVALRRPLDLARLPGQYLAEMYASHIMGQSDEGFEAAPGILYMAAQLRKAALAAVNTTTEGKPGASPPPLLLAFDVETVAPGSLTISSAPEQPDGLGVLAPPRLKVRRLPGGTVELSLRQGQVTPAETFNPAALARAWVWPLPHHDSSEWLPYETLLRSVLSSHPFNIGKVAQRGIGLRLTKSSIQGVHLVAFDMEVRARSPRPPELEGTPFEWNENPLEIWETVVQVKPPSADSGAGATPSGEDGAGGYRFLPLHVKRKQSFQNTLTLSRSAVILALTGGRNDTWVERVNEEEDEGF